MLIRRSARKWSLRVERADLGEGYGSQAQHVPDGLGKMLSKEVMHTPTMQLTEGNTGHL